MPQKPKIVNGTENGLRWEEVTYEGTTYRIRQILVDEADAAYDASVQPDKSVNYRLNSRLALAASIVSPTTGVDDMGKWSNVKLAVMLSVYDRLNSLPAADAEGNASPPAE
jgi:hypothetical protein